MTLALSVYHRLPSAPRTFLASLRGYYLGWWRYDKYTDRLVEEILERDAWGEQQWISWQNERLSFLLERAATRVPYYRDHWSKRRRNGDRASWTYLENWSVLEKDVLRESPRAFVADDCQPSRMFLDHTSGTTGTSLRLWSTRETVKRWYALFEARCRRWYGITRHDRWAILGGQLVRAVDQRTPPFWVWNAGLNQLYLSTFHLAPDLIPEYLEAIARYRIRYIVGYPSALYVLAQVSLGLQRHDLSVDAVITNAEPLYGYQREIISKAFGCPVRETYGMAETVAAASECELGSLHQWPDTGVIETGADNDDSTSDFICTGLVNPDMPLIRYRVGDSGTVSRGSCSCSKSLPVLGGIEGRTDDLLYTADGRRIGRLDPIFKGDLPIREAQIIQESIERLKVKFVPADNFSDSALQNLHRKICDRMGPVHIDFDQVLEIPRTARGKFRAVVCRIPKNELPTLKSKDVP